MNWNRIAIRRSSSPLALGEQVAGSKSEHSCDKNQVSKTAKNGLVTGFLPKGKLKLVSLGTARGTERNSRNRQHVGNKPTTNFPHNGAVSFTFWKQYSNMGLTHRHTLAIVDL